jgi:DNA-binding PadR family transcriptional regulator
MTNLSILELFILSCIDRGRTTPYTMQREAGLSLGATSPTLPRLAKQGLVRRETGRTATNRPKHEYSLTPAGKEQVRAGWRAHIETGDGLPADLDALLRLVDMAKHYGAKPGQLASLVKDAAVTRRQMSKRCSLELPRPDAKEAFGYRNIRAKLDAARYKAEAEGLSRLASDLDRKQSGPTSGKQVR